jgi:hypothetical protein
LWRAINSPLFILFWVEVLIFVHRTLSIKVLVLIEVTSMNIFSISNLKARAAAIKAKFIAISLHLLGMDEERFDRGIFFVPALYLVRVISWLFFDSFYTLPQMPKVGKKQGALVLATHRFRIWDPFTVLRVLPIRRDIAIIGWIGFDGFWAKAAHLVGIENQKLSRQTFITLDKLADYAANGHVVVLFIEGLCVDGRTLGEFKTGAAYLLSQIAKRTNGTEFPVYLYGLEYGNFTNPFHSHIEVRGDVINTAAEGWQARFTAGKKQERKAQMDFTAHVRTRMEQLVAMVGVTPTSQSIRLEDVIGDLYATQEMSLVRRTKCIIKAMAAIDLAEKSELANTLDAYASEADRLRIPVGGELRKPQGFGVLLRLPIVYLGFLLHSIPQRTVTDELRRFVLSGEAVHMRGEFELATWGFTYMRWYSQMLGIFIVLGAIFSLWLGGFAWLPVGIGIGIVMLALKVCLGMYTMRWYRRVNLARLQVWPTKAFDAHKAMGVSLLSELESIRKALPKNS